MDDNLVVQIPSEAHGLSARRMIKMESQAKGEGLCGRSLWGDGANERPVVGVVVQQRDLGAGRTRTGETWTTMEHGMGDMATRPRSVGRESSQASDIEWREAMLALDVLRTIVILGSRCSCTASSISIFTVLLA